MLVGEVSDEAVGVEVLGRVEGLEGAKVRPVTIALCAHMVTHTADRQTDRQTDIVIVYRYANRQTSICTAVVQNSDTAQCNKPLTVLF